MIYGSQALQDFLSIAGLSIPIACSLGNLGSVHSDFKPNDDLCSNHIASGFGWGGHHHRWLSSISERFEEDLTGLSICMPICEWVGKWLVVHQHGECKIIAQLEVGYDAGHRLFRPFPMSVRALSLDEIEQVVLFCGSHHRCGSRVRRRPASRRYGGR
jgi:hypothetical protein